MRRRIAAAAAALSLCCVCIADLTPNAHAFFGFRIVFDPQNYGQNLMTAARTLQTIGNQVRQLRNEANMLVNDAKNLARLGHDPRAEFSRVMAEMSGLMDQATALSYQVSETDRLFRETYPEDYAAWSKTQMATAAEAQWQQARAAHHDAMLVQSQVVENVQADTAQLNGILSSSQSAAGNLAAVQAGNQLAALNAKQAMQMQQLMAAHYRAVALENARALQIEREGKAKLSAFVGSSSAYGGP
jgi:P-type conjugative transfer protein TrbJ